jgi:hypothetical protein
MYMGQGFFYSPQIPGSIDSNFLDNFALLCKDFAIPKLITVCEQRRQEIENSVQKIINLKELSQINIEKSLFFSNVKIFNKKREILESGFSMINNDYYQSRNNQMQQIENLKKENSDQWAQYFM